MLRIPGHIVHWIVSHAEAESPREACGLLLGKDEVKLAFGVPNIHPYPERAYMMDPKSQLHVFQEQERLRLELLAIYHSHPQGHPKPSLDDLEQAYYRVPYVIVCGREVRAFNLRNGVQEVDIESSWKGGVE